MSDTNKTPRNISSAPHFAFGLTSRSMRRRTGALMMGTALGAIVGLGYGRGAYAQVNPLSGTNTSTISLNGPGTFETEDGFSVDTSGSSGSGITISTIGEGDTSFTDGFASSITGSSAGINAYTDGSGTLSISTTGPVTGNFGNGVYAGTNRGSIEISSEGDVSASGGPNSGIYAYVKSSEGGSLSISGSGDISGNFDAIGAFNYGAGHTDINVSGSLISTGHGGLWAINKGTYLSISTGYVSAAGMGILAQNQGSGALEITTNGDVFGVGSGSDYYGNVYAGINAQNSGTDLIITANNVTGGTYGIYADNDGSGALSITSTGTVTGTAEDGIYASNSTAGTDLTIVVNAVTGGADGIDARQYGTGDLSVTANGSVTAEDGAAIRAFHEGTGDLSVTSYGALMAREDAADDDSTNGIFVEHTGSGALTVTSNGTIDATEGDDGIDTEHEGTGDQVITVNAEITADDQAVNADHDGSGDLRITVNADLTADDEGIDVQRLPESSGASGDTVLVVSGDITSRTDNGFEIDHGEGDDYEIDGLVDINVTGAIVAGEDGIDIDSRASGTTSVVVNDVTGGIHGISVDNNGSGALSITANGAVTGGSGDGIDADSDSSEDLTITINEGGSVSTSGTDTDDWAIEAVADNGTVIVNNFGTVMGRVSLTNSNTFTNSGTWDLANTTSDFNATGDSLVQNAGLIVAAQDAAAGETSVIDNLDTFRNQTGGTIRLADGATGDVFRIATTGSGTGDFVANGGTVELDVVLGGDGSATDRLDISGDVILDGAPSALAFSPVGGGTGGATDTGIEVVTVGGTSDAGAFVLAAPVEVGALAYDLSLGDCTDQADQNWYLCNSGTVSSTGAVFEAMPGVILNTFGRTETLQQRLGARITGMPTTVSSRGTGNALVNQSVGPWVRTWGDFTDITPDQSSAGVSWQSDSWGFEAGIGTMLGEPAGGDLIAGVTLRYGSSFAQLDSVNGTGSIEANGFGIGASLTWFGTNGFYVDANGAIDFVSIDATSQGGGTLLDGHDDEVYSASIEIGQRIALAGGTTIVPQAQLSWGRMSSGQVTDELGNLVSFGDRETLTSRIGMTVEWDLAETELGAGQIYGFGNVLHDLSGSRTVTVAGTDVTQSGAGDWVELGGGFSLQPTETTNLFGQISYREAFDGVSGDAVAVSAGLRMQW